MATRTHSRTGPSLLPQSRRKQTAAWQIGEDSRGKVGKGEARHRRRRQAELLQLLILHCVPQSKHNKTKHGIVGREISSLNRPNLEPKWLRSVLLCCCVVVLLCCCVVVLLCCCVVVLLCWCVGVLVCWCVGVLVCWCVGVLVCWCVGVLVCWCVGVLVCWLLLLFCRIYECVYVHSTTVMNWQTRWSPRALTVVSARKIEKLALNSGTTGGARKMTQNAPKKSIIAATEKSSTCLCCELECPPKIRDERIWGISSVSHDHRNVHNRR